MSSRHRPLKRKQVRFNKTSNRFKIILTAFCHRKI